MECLATAQHSRHTRGRAELTVRGEYSASWGPVQ